MLASLSAPGLGPLQARCARGPQPRRARSSAPLFIRASDDEDVVPVISGRFKKGFSADDMERLRHPHLLGGRTIGEELGGSSGRRLARFVLAALNGVLNSRRVLAQASFGSATLRRSSRPRSRKNSSTPPSGETAAPPPWPPLPSRLA